VFNTAGLLLMKRVSKFAVNVVYPLVC